MSKDIIYREDVLRIIDRKTVRGKLQVAREVLKLPPADVQPVVHGEWIDYTEDGYVECPYCHSATNCDGNKDELHFCFSCGADMRGEQDE